MPVPEIFLEYVGFLHVVQQRKPIDDLRITMLKSLTPFIDGSACYFENAVTAAVFKFNQTIVSMRTISDYQVRRVITDDRVFKYDVGRWPDIWIVSSQEG